jgi:hypothetical protein
MPGQVHGFIVALRIPAGADGRYGFTVNYGNAVTEPGPAAEHGLRCWDRVVSYNGIHLGDRRLAEVIAAQASPLIQLKRTTSFLTPKARKATDKAPSLRLSPDNDSPPLPLPGHDRKQCRLLVLRLISKDVRSKMPPTGSPRKMLSFGRKADQKLAAQQDESSEEVVPLQDGRLARRQLKSPGKRTRQPRISEQWLLQRIGREDDDAKWQPRKVALNGVAMLYGQAGRSVRESILLRDIRRLEVGMPQELLFTVCTRSRSYAFKAANRAQFVYWVSELMLLTRGYQTPGRDKASPTGSATGSATSSTTGSRQTSPIPHRPGSGAPPPTLRLSSADLGVLEAYASSALADTDFGDYDDDGGGRASLVSEFDLFDDYDEDSGDDGPVRRELLYESIPEDRPVSQQPEAEADDDLFAEIDSAVSRVAAI